MAEIVKAFSYMSMPMFYLGYNPMHNIWDLKHIEIWVKLHIIRNTGQLLDMKALC